MDIEWWFIVIHFEVGGDFGASLSNFKRWFNRLIECEAESVVIKFETREQIICWYGLINVNIYVGADC